MPRPPTTIDEYLAARGSDQRAALERLRKTIKAAAPKAEECISYGLAAFRLFFSHADPTGLTRPGVSLSSARTNALRSASAEARSCINRSAICPVTRRDASALENTQMTAPVTDISATGKNTWKPKLMASSGAATMSVAPGWSLVKKIFGCATGQISRCHV